MFNNFKNEKWRFIENGYGCESGLDSSDIETFKKDPIASLARESCQNSIDARKGDEPVKIHFKSFEIETNKIPGIKELKNELEECRDSYEIGTKYYKKFEQMINEANENKILCLRISDFNTTGLNGVKSNDRKKSFYYLTKGNGLTTKIGSTSGGSKGIGKFASFVASSIHTVFYSTLNEDDEKGYMGISKLTSRPIKEKPGMSTTGYGYYCNTEKINPILNNLVLDQEFIRNETGTDVYIIGFKESDKWKENIIAKVLDSFMCAVLYGELIIEVNELLINKDTLKEIVYNNDYFTNYEKKQIVSQYVLLTDEFVYKKDVNIDGRGDIRILLKDFSKNENFATNKCVMIRHPYMKIKDENIPFAIPSSAMCIIGKNELNSILREIENPQHIDWEPNRIEEEEFKKEVKNIIQTIKKEIKNFANECLLNSKNKEIDMEGAGEYLPDQELGEATTDLADKNKEEKPKINSKRKVELKNKLGEDSQEENNSLSPDVGDFIEDNEEGIMPEGTNNSNDGEFHVADKSTGYSSDGEKDIMKKVQLSGIKYRILVPDKSKGKYLIIFDSIYEEPNCDLELFYLDNNGNKYIPNISKCTINNIDFEISNNVIRGFKIDSNKKYIFDLDTDLLDFYACEVKMYANR